ncbi:unnamed protein product [Paramecium pentaurelia]|uniref:Casein kinase II subunit beta n=1 Tax=Paramecium pentaurelia TaxID=43138 RepID=A0A8S1UUR1_9CILI|nr:unnamed protein product [Paramecium pentaurelia]
MSQSNISVNENGWIKWYCNLEDHHFFCEIDEFFIADQFNLYGLKQLFDHFEEALQMILSPNTPTDEDLEDDQFLELYNEASELYGLLHARFIITPQGLTLMKSKYLQGRFGVCPRVLCERQNVLPIGLSHDLRTSRVKIFCPRCQDVYSPKKQMSDVDGSFFGSVFPHIFLSVFSELNPTQPANEYVSKIFGFKVHKKKGSKFQIQQNQTEMYYYAEDHIKRLSQIQSSQQQQSQQQQQQQQQSQKNDEEAEKKQKEALNAIQKLQKQKQKK